MEAILIIEAYWVETILILSTYIFFSEFRKQFAQMKSNRKSENESPNNLTQWSKRPNEWHIWKCFMCDTHTLSLCILERFIRRRKICIPFHCADINCSFILVQLWNIGVVETHICNIKGASPLAFPFVSLFTTNVAINKWTPITRKASFLRLRKMTVFI